MANIAGKAVSAKDKHTRPGQSAADPGADRHIKDVVAFAAHAEALFAEGHCQDVVHNGDAKRDQLLSQPKASETGERVGGGDEDATFWVDEPGGCHTGALDLHSFTKGRPSRWGSGSLVLARRPPAPRRRRRHWPRPLPVSGAPAGRVRLSRFCA